MDGKKLKFFVITCLLIVEIPLMGHARFKVGSATTPPRSDDTGLKSEPCGGVDRIDQKVYKTGATLTVEWEETINHPGYYIVSLLEWSGGEDEAKATTGGSP